MFDPSTQYYILDGVRRSVAAREAGKGHILAHVQEPGKPDVFVRVSHMQLHSCKAYVVRNYRYIRYTEYPTVVLKTEPPPIIVEPLGLHGRNPNPTELARVVLR